MFAPLETKKSNVHRWAQEEVGVPLGVLTEGSIEKCNQDCKVSNTRFVARTSMENVHRNTLTRRSWEADPLLHYEETVQQVGYIDRRKLHVHRRSSKEGKSKVAATERRMFCVFVFLTLSAS